MASFPCRLRKVRILVLTFTAFFAANNAAADPPHIIHILADDLGYVHLTLPHASTNKQNGWSIDSYNSINRSVVTFAATVQRLRNIGTTILEPMVSLLWSGIPHCNVSKLIVLIFASGAYAADGQMWVFIATRPQILVMFKRRISMH
eukprot:m.334506 g.334506  ORF g.334506 m.334506 type:complete len:147 (+) comp20507_c1_seq3:254-694(+)